MSYVHSGHDLTIILHLCILGCSLILGSFIRAKVSFFRKYLIPAPMIGGFFLLVFYNFIAGSLCLETGREFFSELIFHLLNISFIAIQLRIPEPKNLVDGKNKNPSLWQNVTALVAEYGLQCFFGLLVVVLFFKNTLGGSAKVLGLTLCLGFELGPGQAQSMASVWENDFGVRNASDVGLAMAAIGFIIGSIIGVVLINRAAKKGWLAPEYVEKLRHRKSNNGFLKNKEDRVSSSCQTTASESMDTLTLHVAIILLTYLLSIGFLAGIEFLTKRFLGNVAGGKIVEAITGLWGINFVVSSLFAIIVRNIICKAKIDYVIDNGTCNRIDGIAVDLTVAACLGAIELSALKEYWALILVLTVVGCIITCYITPWFCSRLFKDYSFIRFLMIFGTANGTLPTALSLVRVVDPDFETPAAKDYVNSTGIMFFFALPILALVNHPAKTQSATLMLIVTGLYIVIAFIMYLKQTKGKGFVEPGTYFYHKSEIDK